MVGNGRKKGNRRVFCDRFSGRFSSVREILRSTAKEFYAPGSLLSKFDAEAARDFVREFCNAPTIAVRSARHVVIFTLSSLILIRMLSGRK